MKDLWKNTFKRFSGLLLVCPVLFLQTSLEPQDNLKIFNRLASITVKKIVDQALPDSSSHVAIKSLSQQQPGNWWIENWLVTELKSRDVTKIFINQQVKSEDGMTFEFRIADLGVKYLPLKDKNLVSRLIKISLDVRILQGEAGFVKSLENVTEQFVDTVQVKILAQLEDKNYAFTSAKAPEKFAIQKYVEPVVIMGATAGVIYLFFRLRSK